MWECWWVRSEERRGKERSQAEQLNCERDCDDRECIWENKRKGAVVRRFKRCDGGGGDGGGGHSHQ